MRYEIDENKLWIQEWERVNALEYLRKDRIAGQQKTDIRVISIEDTCVWQYCSQTYRRMIITAAEALWTR